METRKFSTPYGEIEISIGLVTKEMAEEWLQHNDRNRSVSSARASAYAHDMEEGNWSFTGETVVFYSDGMLKDGQHRLRAIVKTGKPQWMILVRGIPTTVTIHDKHSPRSTGNTMELSGFAANLRSTSIIGAVKLFYRLFKPGVIASDSDVMNFVMQNKDLLIKANSCVFVGAKNSIMRKAPIVAAIFSALYCGMPEEEVMEFCRVAATGFATSEYDSPAIVLRNSLLTSAYSDSGMQFRETLYRITCLALADYHKKTTRKRMYTVGSTSAFESRVKNGLFGG